MGKRALVVKSTGIFKVSILTVGDVQYLTWRTLERGKETILNGETRVFKTCPFRLTTFYKMSMPLYEAVVCKQVSMG